MAREGFILSEQDKDALKVLFQEWTVRNRVSGVKGEDWVESQGSEFHAAKTPTDGIPARTEPTSDADYPHPGVALCAVYSIEPQDVLADFPENEQYNVKPVDQYYQMVFNVGDTEIPGNTFILIAKDRYGYWQPLISSEASFLALLVGVTLGTYLRPYSWLRLGSYDPVLRTYSVTDQGGPLFGTDTSYAYQTRNILIPHAIQLEAGTGTFDLDAHTGTGTGSVTSVTVGDVSYLFHPLCVVRMWPGRSGDTAPAAGVSVSRKIYLFDEVPWEDLVRLTGDVTEDGADGFERLWDQENNVWVDGIPVVCVVAD